jgi:hypothetical protein
MQTSPHTILECISNILELAITGHGKCTLFILVERLLKHERDLRGSHGFIWGLSE